MDLRLRLLGDVRLDRAGEIVSLGSERQRRLVVALALAGPQELTVEELVTRVWDEGEEPERPVAALRTYVNRLRATAGSDLMFIETRPGGYALGAEVAIDCEDFEDLLRHAAETDDPESAKLLRERAASLWEGPPFSPLGHLEWVRPEAIRLEELHLDATETSLAALLESGSFTLAALEAARLLEEHPYRERFREIQMLALYGDHRQADALRAYDEHRTQMLEDLGIDPSPALQELQHRILTQDPSLEVATTPARVWRQQRRVVVAAAVAIVAVALASIGLVVAQRRGSNAETNNAQRLADSQRLVTTAVALSSEDPDLALLLSAEAQRLSPDVPIPVALFDAIGSALDENRAVASFDSEAHGYSRVRYADVSSAGSRLLVGDHDSLKVLDTTTSEVLWSTSTGGDGWYRYAQFTDGERVVVVNRQDTNSLMTGFFYQGTLLRPGTNRSPGSVELFDIEDGAVLLDEPVAASCATNFTAIDRYLDLERGRLAYSDFTDGPCDDFGAYAAVVMDLESSEELYRGWSDEPSMFPEITLGADRAIWYDASRSAYVVVDLRSGTEVAIPGEEGWSQPSPDGQLVALIPGGSGGPLIYDATSGDLIDRLTGPQAGASPTVYGLWWDQSSARVFTAGDGALSSWNVETGELEVTVTDPNSSTGNGGVADNGDLAVTQIADSDLVRIWDTRVDRPQPGILASTVQLSGVVDHLSGGGDLLAGVRAPQAVPVWGTADRDGFAEVADGTRPTRVSDSSVIWQLADERGLGPPVRGTPDGSVATELDGICWSESVDDRPPTCRNGQAGVAGELGHAAPSPDGSQIAALITTATPDFVASTRVHAWSASGALLSRTDPLDIAPDATIAWVDPKTVVTAGGLLVDLDSMRATSTGLQLSTVAGTSDTIVVGGTIDGALHRITRAGSEPLVDELHDGPIRKLAVSAEGLVATYGDDGTVVVFDPDARAAIRQVPVARGAPELAWTSDGTLAAVSETGQLRLFNFEEVDLAALAEQLVGRSLTELECLTHLERACADWRNITGD